MVRLKANQDQARGHQDHDRRRKKNEEEEDEEVRSGGAKTQKAKSKVSKQSRTGK